MTRIVRDTSYLRAKYRRGGPLAGNGANTASKVIGGKGRRVSTPKFTRGH